MFSNICLSPYISQHHLSLSSPPFLFLPPSIIYSNHPGTPKPVYNCYVTQIPAHIVMWCTSLDKQQDFSYIATNIISMKTDHASRNKFTLWGVGHCLWYAAKILESYIKVWFHRKEREACHTLEHIIYLFKVIMHTRVMFLLCDIIHD